MNSSKASRSACAQSLNAVSWRHPPARQSSCARRSLLLLNSEVIGYCEVRSHDDPACRGFHHLANAAITRRAPTFQPQIANVRDFLKIAFHKLLVSLLS
jgi:hypothetical protein